ncbi:hypothetical protein OXYTRIMIC_198 [Oxytricha trifallax]|uniref:Uncharacterized protein n=1 Tax=Oxytricha trifallax TaxID=1172189 RepID=A0A073HYK0_9SPIT|nr:hypothetical protein OXYTRIMIC_198 [Oxytricha trifallax]
MLQFLPDQCDWIHLDKRWICDVLMTIDRNGISDMVHQAKQQRLDKMNKSKNLLVNMRPEFAQALNNSLQFSCKLFCFNRTLEQRGRSAFLLKETSQRKRRQRDIEEVKGEESLLNQSKQKYLEQNKRVRQEIMTLQEQVDELADYKNLVMQLHQAGIINEDGNPLQQPHQDNNIQN